MFSSLLRPKRHRQTSRRPSQYATHFDHSASPAPSARQHLLRNAFTPTPHRFRSRRRESVFDGHDIEEEYQYAGRDNEDDEEAIEDEDDDGISGEDGADAEEQTPLLPIFSAAHLDSISVYTVTHSIKNLIEQRCETTLTWEQLRSPQISQFLVKPIQQQILKSYFSRATLYALLANCLQFIREGQLNPGNVGVLRTRALCSELLATRLLREYTWQELIDALSYDFDPLSGREPQQILVHGVVVPRAPPARTSTLEVAIRADAKRFIAHPVCVQHLEAIWAGKIVFHSAADSLHRYPSRPPLRDHRHYGAMHHIDDPALQSHDIQPHLLHEMLRRSVSLYDPSDASLFKLSRLRVPRYRNFFSTFSYAIMLGLFLAVLIQRSLHITALEVLFWVWGAGFMLDEIIGFSEQGFSLYFLSVWNGLDIGILALFAIYYALRLFGLLIAEHRKLFIANMAYDVLASTAVLLFPRLFSLLDHYRYFSQLLIAFRLMAQDLVAVLMLIAITCSGFFVAITLSFSPADTDGLSVMYDLFRILMGFTPAVWDNWDQYNYLGRLIMAIFMIISHFVVVTILITVLTNSFMAIVKNANEEHLYLFSINVLSMVKSDALFSYLPPTNVLGWVCTPLRYIMPFRYFVRVNRNVIKITHFPVLLCIYLYERIIASQHLYAPHEKTDIDRGRSNDRLATQGLSGTGKLFANGPTVRVREPSIATYRKDLALEEVFLPTHKKASSPRKSSTSKIRHVDSWMNGMDDSAGPPQEQPQDDFEVADFVYRPNLHRSATSASLSNRRRSILFSDADERSITNVRKEPPQNNIASRRRTSDTLDQPTEAEFGDDEQEDEQEQASIHEKVENAGAPSSRPIPIKQEPRNMVGSSQASRPFSKGHNRHTSVSTIVYRPEMDRKHSSSTATAATTAIAGRVSPHKHGSISPGASNLSRSIGQRKREQRYQNSAKPIPTQSNIRSITPPQGRYESNQNMARFLNLTQRAPHREPSLDAIALDLASDIGDNRPYGAGMTENINAMLSSSYQTHLGDYPGAMRAQNRKEKEREEETNMMGRIVLARMNTLEEGFKDILKEVKDWRHATNSHAINSHATSGDSTPSTIQRKPTRKSVGRERRRTGESFPLYSGSPRTPVNEEVIPRRKSSILTAIEAPGPSTMSVTTMTEAEVRDPEHKEA